MLMMWMNILMMFMMMMNITINLHILVYSIFVRVLDMKKPVFWFVYSLEP